MDVAIKRIAETSKINKSITEDTISLLFADGTANQQNINPCNHESKGCDWMGTATDRQKHCCPYDLIPCPSAQCTVIEERRKMQDHIPFCRFALMSNGCKCCGRGGFAACDYSTHIENVCPAFHSNVKKMIDVLDKKNKPTGTKKSTWVFTFISDQHLERAFAASREHSARLIKLQASIRIGSGKATAEEAIRSIDNTHDNAIRDLHEMKDEETGETQADENPFNWDLDRLLNYVDEHSLRRAKKRKKQAEIVSDFITRNIEKEHKKETNKAERAFQEIESTWMDRIKQSKWAVNNRMSQAKDKLHALLDVPKAHV